MKFNEKVHNCSHPFATKQKPTVYVLVRLFCPDVAECDTYLEKLSVTLRSVEKNRSIYCGRLVLLINDDTKHLSTDHYSYYIYSRNKLLQKMFGDKNDAWMETDSPGGEGSACSMYNLRKLFVDVAKDDDIAVTLDQDDRLRLDAVARIACRMKPNGVVISSFIEKGDVALDIIGDRGRGHRLLVRRLSCQAFADRFMKGKTKKSIADLSSIGWTKSYTRSIMARFLSDIEALMGGREGVTRFFTEHKAYEDFIDFYVLLFNDIKLSAVGCRTHNYFKNSNSITANPSVDDFRYHRTAMLVALIDLCYSRQGSDSYLCSDFKDKLFRYVTNKTQQVEDILEAYKEKKLYPELSAKIFRRYFVNNLCRIAGGYNMDRIAKPLGEVCRRDESASNFENLLLVGKNCPTKNKIVDDLQNCWNAFNGNHTEDNDTIIDRLINNYPIPREKQFKKIEKFEKGFLIAIVVIVVILLIVLILKLMSDVTSFCGLFCNDTIFQTFRYIRSFSTFIAALVALISAVFTYLYTEKSKLKVLSESDKSAVKLYYSEFLDFARHIEANIKVMLQISHDLSEGKTKVQEIHLGNLKWPETSTLFSHEMAKLIDRTRVDDLARLMVNMRNINNSAVWLRRMAMKGEDLSESLKWETMRHFGYLVNVCFMRDNDFQFPNKEQLENYIYESPLKVSLSSFFMFYDEDDPHRKEELENYIKRYFNDRHDHRDVLTS